MSILNDSKTVERPSFVKEEHLAFLDDLRESGITNMFGAPPYLRKAFKGLKEPQATQVVSYWMKTFGARHPQGK
jgi:hypothetical protein